MTTRWVRTGAGATIVASVAALAVTTPAAADTRTKYDGEATAFQTEGLTLTLFPSDAGVPEAFQDLPMPPEQIVHLSPDQLGLPTRFGHAEFRGVDDAGDLPSNPLINGNAFRAASTKQNGSVVSEAVIGNLDIASGALTVENLAARCTGDGDQVALEAPVGSLTGSGVPSDASIELEPNTDIPVPGLGSVRWNHQITDQKTFGSVSNLVVTLDTDIDADVLQQLPEAMGAFEDTVQQLLSEIQKAGTEAGFPALPADVGTMSGQQLYDTLDALLAELPTSEIPDLNSVLQLSGSITLSDATCSQEVVSRPDNPPPPPGEDRPDAPAEQPPGAEPREPPLADTGASPWGPRATFAGLGALLAGGALLALRRRRPVDED
ncbi:MAG: choice-of-anchor P family protein [Nocardioidaceae bacterium]